MTDAVETTPVPSGSNEPITVPENPAVARCMKSWIRAFREARANNKSEYDSNQVAIKAYRDAMPSPCGYESVRDFIACVARAMLLGIIDGDDSTKLLYAAQVALGAVRRQPPAPKPAA